MNRRHFIKLVPALVLTIPAVAAMRPVPCIPKSIMLTWTHRDNPDRHGARFWNVESQAAYDQFLEEAVGFHALLASQNYDVKYAEFKTLRFV